MPLCPALVLLLLTARLLADDEVNQQSDVAEARSRWTENPKFSDESHFHSERWARHWLDVVRFAETHGFEMNQPRGSAWRYRDYVIRAFEEDKPYDRFILEQIAGDVVGVDEATGFLVAGPWDQVKSPDPVLTANQRADELHDIVSTTCSTFLGLTVGCARCHDHKFDPISQQDYYAIRAVFEGVQHGERKLPVAQGAVAQKEIDVLKRQIAETQKAIEGAEPIAANGEKVRAPVSPKRNIERVKVIEALKLRFTVLKTSGAEPCIDELEVFSSSGENVALAKRGTKVRASGVYPNSEIHRMEHVNDGLYGNGKSWISNEAGKGWIQLEFPEPVTITRVVWGRDREEKFADRVPTEYRIEVRTRDDSWEVIASSADRLPVGTSPPGNPLFSKRTELETKLRQLTDAPMAYAGVFKDNPEPTYRLNRGDPMQPREEVKPGGLSSIPVPFPSIEDEEAKNLTEDQKRRLAFARWLIDPRNPLTARVMVNRIWQYHFGEGLVGTPSDFGANGANPTNPELLDWLAKEFVDHGWSIKHVHNLILRSKTFRQSSASRPEALARDAGNRCLWRFTPRRLEAEPIRDAILAVSGNLDLRAGGPGFSFFEPNDNYVRVYTPRTNWTPETCRRMVYGTVVRQRPDGVFGAFDCPDAGQIAPKRTSSTTPLQALNLLNSSFIMQQAEVFAKRVQREAPDKPIERAFRLAFHREPAEEELAAAQKLVDSEGLPALCRALFNANEFVYLF